MRRFALLFSAAILVVGLLLVEVVLRALAPIPDPYGEYKNLAVMKYLPGQFRPHQRFTFHPEQGLPGMKPEATFTTNNRGLRGSDLVMPKPADEFRIFTIGGSAMECLLLDDSEDASRVLENELRRRLGSNVKVYGAAKSGAASFDDISMLVHRLVYFDPDLIVDLTGVNDALASLNRYDYLHYDEEMRLGLTFRYLATEFQVFRRLQVLGKRVLGARRQSARDALQALPLDTNISEKAEISRSMPARGGGPGVDTSFFEANLRTLGGVADAHGFRLVFVTQPTTWNSPDPRAAPWHWMTMGFDEQALDAAVGSINEVTHRVGAATSTPVYDFASELPKSMDFFYDDVHFNTAGAAKLGEGVAAFIERAGLAK